MPFKISRQAYAETYGPTKGDRIRLADTDLILEVEEDRTHSVSYTHLTLPTIYSV